MSEKPARCKCLHTQRSHAMRKINTGTRLTYKRLGLCMQIACPCQGFVRPLADSLAASFGRQRNGRQPVGVAPRGGQTT